MSLLNTDYKIFAKLLANRLKQCIDSIVHIDQSYCVPNRCLHDNLNLIRDMLAYANSTNLPFAILNLDQKKAFDNVDHEYLFSVLRAMGFGDGFIKYIKLLYTQTESLVKIGNSLTVPFTFEKGIRQGCPLSGLLYTLSIEPLLSKLRLDLNEHCFRLPNSPKCLSVSAYADDVSVFITSENGFQIVTKTYNLFSSASAARLNTFKSQGLWAGCWTGRSDTPLGFSWKSEGLQFLGLHFGNSFNYTKQNWTTCKNKILKTLACWKRLLPILSYKGKTLIVNQLAASKNLPLSCNTHPARNVHQ